MFLSLQRAAPDPGWVQSALPWGGSGAAPAMLGRAIQVTEHLQQLRMDLVKELGLMAYRFLITLNSGAFIVLLTFIGNISENPRFSIELESLKVAMYSFLSSIVLTFVSMTVAYISTQYHLVGKNLPGASSTIGHVVWLTLPVAGAFVAFVFGVYSAMQGIS
ncbi:hypothetical protein [uncultured Roseobacter sp.]|uniref:hypothetical protein n=1 Tax=uncultured Roseobacter sp. TaxID=114847 RepID=UPI00260D1BAD|nr:hypothetical protein [uncultured Roseobacter sp.]